ncbi:orotidine-5'-phosphate decarboxylase [Simiduia aestuariiviva]|uniref:Orotidine 5'-phosphate decarboxylase n=1 Tax=Simiduia aestuariiviva TaxID=1510459 RepID=A0A839USL6_9GAMM|nr:orotidine-5'-phosphate decarboxylase [Simiduia aestuariiviva]MBB3168377.1 orotidine-5'-phosphate decarboxylase [Simiduia aestuariiviva]
MLPPTNHNDSPSNDSPIIVALDYPTALQALAMADQLDPALCRVKVGKELFTAEGPALVKSLIKRGFDVFLDLKFHDIPNTVAKAVAVAAEMGVWMVNVHASGGSRMMQAARDALTPFGDKAPLLIAVTVLTSSAESELAEIGLEGGVEQQVLKLAKLAKGAGLDGVVCSAREASILRQEIGEDFTLVTPGIRPEGSAKNDQVRTLTPVEALTNGVNYMVIGRPVTQSADPSLALRSIIETL